MTPEEIITQTLHRVYYEYRPLQSCAWWCRTCDWQGETQADADTHVAAEAVAALRADGWSVAKYPPSPQFAVMGDWLAVGVDSCTCFGGDAHYGHEPGCGYEPVAKLDAVLAALQTRYAVTQLPEPGPLSDHHEDGMTVFYYGQDGEITVDDDALRPLSDAEGFSFSVGFAREHAAALLAAAREVEDKQ